jgi:uncharacterized membrane protein
MTRRLSLAVAGLGLAIAAYLTVVHFAGGEPVCAIAHGCATVQESAYAELAGVPVALLGLLGYVAILVSLARDARTTTAALAFAGFGFSAWLTYVEVFEINAICVWCVASALCMTALAGLSAARLAP